MLRSGNAGKGVLPVRAQANGHGQRLPRSMKMAGDSWFIRFLPKSANRKSFSYHTCDYGICPSG